MRAESSAMPGWLQGLQRSLLGDRTSVLITLSLLLLLWHWGPGLIDWLLLKAIWHADVDACQAARGVGACWGVITEKHRLILFGRYPPDAHWRPLLASGLLVGTVLSCAWPRLWQRGVLPVVLGLCVPVALVVAVLMGGGVGGLEPVPTERWGGLPLTLLLSVGAMVLACPLALLLALGRRSRLPVLRWTCAMYIELVRGVPLITVLFMASFLFPLFLPVGTSPDVLLRVLIGVALFAAAYLAETLRAGLQSVPHGQVEAAESLGLSRWQILKRVVLPQALSAVLPGLLNSFISTFKDSSLITIVSLYELTGALGLALNGDPQWRPFMLEGYLFITAIYFVACWAMSRFGLTVERHLARGRGGAVEGVR